MASGRKISEVVATRRSMSPLIAYIRDKLSRFRRAGFPTYKHMEHNRYPEDQSARSQPAPSLPAGVKHQLAANYYYERDARRDVIPPVDLVHVADSTTTTHGAVVEVEAATAAAAAVNPETADIDAKRVDVLKGPAENFGLPTGTPTPGAGVQWRRSRTSEDLHIQSSRDFAILESYDRYAKAER